MFTRFLFKPLVTFTILALLLLPQIGETSTALAAKPTTTIPTPVSLAVPDLDCLDVTGSTILTGQVVPVSEPDPPGTGVKFTIYPRVVNNCTTTVSNIIVTFTFNAVCPPPSISNAIRSTFTPDPPSLASGKPAFGTNKYLAYCTTYSDTVPSLPISSQPPTSISTDISATAADANGQEVYERAVKTLSIPF